MPNKFRRPSALVLVAATVLLAGGCGRFVRSGAERGAGPPPETADVGTEVSLGASTTAVDPHVADPSPTQPPRAGGAPRTTASAQGQPRSASTTTAAPRDVCEGNPGPTPNLARRNDPSGLRLDLVVADRLCFDSREGFRIELRVTNVGGDPVFYDSHRYQMFTVSPADGRSGPTWSDSPCGGSYPPASPGPGIELSPGEDVRFVAEYPPMVGSTRESSPCHTLEPGEYYVSARFRICPDGSRGRGYCDPGETVDIPSAALRIRIS